ncbi:MAG TPA: TetR/AcrR family transcriptional regulator C-terminal domain-containing protein [Ktedonobacterales bacterium]|jgi:AcrR family transcriptional regulator
MSENKPDHEEEPTEKKSAWRHQGPTHGWKHHGPAHPKHQPLKHEPIWMRPARQPQGQRPSLSREQIVRAAIELADAEGLEELSMRRLATKLGAGAMSLYWHIPNKEDLLDLMLDAAFGEMTLPEPLSGAWRADLRQFAHLTLGVLRRHTWLPSLLSSRLLPGPNTLRYVELFLADLGGLGLDDTTIADILSTVDAYVDGFAQREAAAAESRRQAGMTEAEWQAALAAYYQQVLSSGQYPMLARIITENTEINANASFEFGLECVLDGIAVRIAATGGS